VRPLHLLLQLMQRGQTPGRDRHRRAGAVIGQAVPRRKVDDVSSGAKTLPHRPWPASRHRRRHEHRAGALHRRRPRQIGQHQRLAPPRQAGQRQRGLGGKNAGQIGHRWLSTVQAARHRAHGKQPATPIRRAGQGSRPLEQGESGGSEKRNKTRSVEADQRGMST
jgi:hypothetical protein